MNSGVPTSGASGGVMEMGSPNLSCGTPSNRNDEGFNLRIGIPSERTREDLVTSSAIASIETNVAGIWDDLCQHLIEAADGLSAGDLVRQCFDLYMRHLFPITPLVHEASIRSCLSTLFNETVEPDDGTRMMTPPSSVHTDLPSFALPTSGNTIEALARHAGALQLGQNVLCAERTITLLTAICAAVACLLPTNLFVVGPRVSHLFLVASRRMLQSYQDQDIENPCATSLVIRYLHTNCVHAAGHLQLSWHILGDTIRLAQELKVFDEASFDRVDHIEATLRRATFWQLSTGDKSSAILNLKPFTLYPWNFDKPLSVAPVSDEESILLDYQQTHNTPELAICVNRGFNLISTIFTYATDVLMNIRLLREFNKRPSSTGELLRGQKAATVDSLMVFQGVLDDMPETLRYPYLRAARDDAMQNKYLEHYTWIQHANVMLTFQCLRLILLQKAVEMGFADVFGFSQDPNLLAMQKLDIARDVLTCIRSVPFEALQINSEPCVEKIRQVGACLLELSQNTVNPRAATRARVDLQEILGLLTRLDSKASDTLCRQMNAT